MVDGLSQGESVHPFHACMDQSALGEFGKDGDDAAGAVDVLDVVFLRVRRHLAEAWRLS